MKTLEDFTKKQPPKRRKSKLNEYGKEIKELYNMGYRVPQIREFLSINGIKISCTSIYNFLSKKNVNNRNKTAGGSKNETKKPKDINELRKEFEENPVFDVFKKRIQKSKELAKEDKEK